MANTAIILELPASSFSRPYLRAGAQNSTQRNCNNHRTPPLRYRVFSALGGHHVALTAALAEAPQRSAVTVSLDAEAGRRLLEASYDAEAAEEFQTALPSTFVTRISNQVRTPLTPRIRSCKLTLDAPRVLGYNLLSCQICSTCKYPSVSTFVSRPSDITKGALCQSSCQSRRRYRIGRLRRLPRQHQLPVQLSCPRRDGPTRRRGGPYVDQP